MDASATEPPVDWLTESRAFAGFEIAVLVDRAVYAAGETVRFTVTATNHGERFVEHHYPGWQRYELTVRDASHHVVADDDADAPGAEGAAVDRWLPGQTAIWPVYWSQAAGPIVPAWGHDVPGLRVPPGRYRARVTWLGREPGSRDRLADAWSSWFDLT